jgi:hypothetical protein
MRGLFRPIEDCVGPSILTVGPLCFTYAREIFLFDLREELRLVMFEN